MSIVIMMLITEAFSNKQQPKGQISYTEKRKLRKHKHLHLDGFSK